LIAPGEPRVATRVPVRYPSITTTREPESIALLATSLAGSGGHGIRRADPGTDPGLRGRDMPVDARSWTV